MYVMEMMLWQKKQQQKQQLHEDINEIRQAADITSPIIAGILLSRELRIPCICDLCTDITCTIWHCIAHL